MGIVPERLDGVGVPVRSDGVGVRQQGHRYSRERKFYDRQSNGAKAQCSVSVPGQFSGAAAAQRFAFATLRGLGNVSVLDLGAGTGWTSLSLARQGARVTAADVSPVALNRLQQAAESLGLSERIRTQVVEGDTLPFSDEIFDIVFGNAVLHHLQLESAMHEIHRVLGADGIGIFCEPLAHNPAINLYRRVMPRRYTEDEHALTVADLTTITRLFPVYELRFFELLALPGFLLRRHPLRRFCSPLYRFDDRLFERAPHLRRFARSVVIRVQK